MEQEKIISLKAYKHRKAATLGFARWASQLKESEKISFDENTRWSEIPDSLLLKLSQDNSESRLLYYHLIMSSLGLGTGYDFEVQTPAKFTELLDIFFLLVDQSRFECMRRIGWIDTTPLGGRSIINLILKIYDGEALKHLKVNHVNDSHPALGCEEGFDLEVQVRKYTLDAIEAFRQQIEDS